MSTIVRAGSSSISSTAALPVLTAPGGGVTDDGPLIRAQLATAPPGSTIYGIPGRTYLVGTPLTAPTFKVPSGTTSMPYILAIPSGVTLDLRGATLKLKAGTDAVLITNAGALTAAPADTDIGLINAVLDGNNVSLTNKGLAMFTGVTRLTLSLKVKNATNAGIQCYNIDHGDFPLLDADTVAGNAFSFGQNSPSGQDVRDCRFGIVRAKNVTPDPNNTVTRPGNSLAGVFQRCTIDLVEARNCDAGIKIEQPSSDMVIGRVFTDGCGDSSGNSGLKLQGTSTSTATMVYRVTIGELIATNQTAHGLWMEYSADCHVGSYIGRGNQTLGTGPDVWLGGARDTLASINSTSAGGDAVLFRSYSADLRLGNVTIRNPGQVSGATSKVGVSIPFGTASIRSIAAIDDQGTPTMTSGVNVTGTAAVVQCGDVYVKGSSGTAVAVVTGGATTRRVQISGNPTYAQLVVTGIADAIPTGQALAVALRTGLWYPALPCTGISTNQLPNQALRLTPMDVPRALTLTGLAVEVTTAGETGCTFRLGIYGDDGTGYPGALILDAGTVAADTTGVKTVTISQALLPGRCWVGGATQGAATTAPTIRTPANAMVSIGQTATPGTSSSNIAYSQTGVSGALPSTFTASVAAGGQAPRIYVQVA